MAGLEGARLGPEARQIASEFEEIARGGRYASAYAEAAIWAGLGEKDRAMALLARAFDEHSHWLLWLKRDPRWTPLRSDPRFLDLVKKVGLPA